MVVCPMLQMLHKIPLPTKHDYFLSGLIQVEIFNYTIPYTIIKPWGWTLNKDIQITFSFHIIYPNSSLTTTWNV